MEKRRYVPMTVEYEKFEMNEAVAGACTYLLKNSGATCEDCADAGISHTFTTYNNSEGEWIGIANESANSVRNPGAWQTSSCDYSSTTNMGGVMDGNTRRSVMQGDAIYNSVGRDGYFDPIPANQTPGLLYQIETSTRGGFWYDENGNIVYNATS